MPNQKLRLLALEARERAEEALNLAETLAPPSSMGQFFETLC